MPGPALHSHSRGAKTPPAAPTSYSGRGPGLRPKPKTGPKAVPDSFHRKGNSADPPTCHYQDPPGGPRCTAFPRGPTTRTRRSSVIRRRAARLVMARDATQLSTRTRHTSCTGPNDVSGDSDTLPRPTAQPGAIHAPKTRQQARAADPILSQPRPARDTKSPRPGLFELGTTTKPERRLGAPQTFSPRPHASIIPREQLEVTRNRK